MMNRVDLRCLLDEAHQIVEAHSASGLCDASSVTGTNFLSAITDASLRELFYLVIARVRETGRPMMFYLRCDTADVRRRSYVRLGMHFRDAQSWVEVVNGTEEEAPHAQRLALLDPAAERGTGLLKICSWCKQVKLDEHRWTEVEEAMRELRLMEQPVLPRLSHGMCPTCAEAVRAEFARQIAALDGMAPAQSPGRGGPVG